MKSRRIHRVISRGHGAFYSPAVHAVGVVRAHPLPPHAAAVPEPREVPQHDAPQGGAPMPQRGFHLVHSLQGQVQHVRQIREQVRLRC